jgi:type II secretory pathway pseudopilin PulG
MDPGSLNLNNMTHTKRYKRGFTAIEIAIGVTLAGLILVYSMYSITQFINTARDISEKTEALYLAEDGIELIRFVRDEAWTNLSSLPVNTTRYLHVSTTTIGVTTTPEVVVGFSRSFTVQNVYRNGATDDIVASTTGGSVADSNSKYVFMTVSWASSTKSVSLTTILAQP